MLSPCHYAAAIALIFHAAADAAIITPHYFAIIFFALFSPMLVITIIATLIRR
jgi:hypothetical protein